jgi:predicted AAA+ superfamily ATPase
MIFRPWYFEQLRQTLRRSPICTLLGPRQTGKSTLARELARLFPQSHLFDLESPTDLLRLTNPEFTLSRLSGLVILDEIQLRRDLFPILRVLADRPDTETRFLILGSAAPQLIRHSSESLAGHIQFVDLHGFNLSETGPAALESLWLRGGFPRSFLADNDADSTAWRESFVRTFLERDLPQFGLRINASAMRRFWTMLAHRHGQIWNASELARSMALSDKTVRNWLDELSLTFMVRQLPPWFQNLGKRLVKSPKVYLRDSGLLHHLLGLSTHHQLQGHPTVGASWEGFALEQILQLLRPADAWFYATQSGAELDLFLQHNGRRLGFEFKYSESPRTTRSMRIALTDLQLDHLWIICPGSVRAQLDDQISVCGLTNLEYLRQAID